MRKLIIRSCIVQVRNGYSVREEVGGFVMERAGGRNVWVLSDLLFQELEVFVEFGTNCLV